MLIYRSKCPFFPDHSTKKGIEIERPMFVLGARKEKNHIMTMPLAVKLPHASLHPQLFGQMLSVWRKLREQPQMADQNSLYLRARL